MAQSEGIFGAVKSFIPGMSTEEDHKQSSAEEHEVHNVTNTALEEPTAGGNGGILSYIPGFGGGSEQQRFEDRSNSDDDTRTTRSGAVYGRSGSDDQARNQATTGLTGGHGSATVGHQHSDNRNQPLSDDKYYDDSDDKQERKHDGFVTTGQESGKGTGLAGAHTRTSGDINNTVTEGFGGSDSAAKDRAGGLEADTALPGSGGGKGIASEWDADNDTSLTGSNPRYRSGSSDDSSTFSNRGGSGVQNFGDSKSNAYLAAPPDVEFGNDDNDVPYQGEAFRNDTGVKGTPIEGENMKGYTVSAPVGSGDTSQPGSFQNPSGQVSGAHMKYGPSHNDDRDSTGRGTFGTTVGDGDSSFANITRTDGNNTEHVVSHSSRSSVKHTSTTQL